MSLRSALTTNLPVKITSVVLSVFLWFLAAGEENATTLLPVDVAIRAPAGRSLLHPAGPLRALVVGPRRELLKLSATPLRLSRILPDTILADEVHLDLDPGDLEVPQGIGVHVQDLEPRSLLITLDSTFQRVVPVRAIVRLRPETGFALGAISVVPGTVRLMGSRAQLQTSGFGTVRAMPQEVSIRVDVEVVGSRTIAGVPSGTARALRPDRETGRVRLRVIAPAGVAACAEPDSVDLVPRSGCG